MSLLFDQNISFRVVRSLADVYPGCIHVRLVKLENSFDIDIWRYARNNELAIVTFDADFYDISTLMGHPPKIIWLRTGNTSTENLIEIFLDKQKIIQEFLQNDSHKEISCLEIK